MKITVNNTPLELHNGAKVKDAILKYYSQQGNNSPKYFPLVEDRYGNKVACDGELTDGNTLFIRTQTRHRHLHSRNWFLPYLQSDFFSPAAPERKQLQAKQVKNKPSFLR